MAECPYNGWVDEVELCVLWNQVQGLQATTQELIILVQQLLAAGGRRKREDLTTPANYVNMSTDEQETILVLIEVYTCLYECCQTRDCNETYIQEMSSKVYQQNQKLKIAYTNMTSAYIDGQQYFFDKIEELDSGKNIFFAIKYDLIITIKIKIKGNFFLCDYTSIKDKPQTQKWYKW